MSQIACTRFAARPDGQPGCSTCGMPATRWITYDLYLRRERITEAFCAWHGSWLLLDTYRLPAEQPFADPRLASGAPHVDWDTIT